MRINKIRNIIRPIGLFFARPHILFYTLPWLMFLIVMGTVTQKNLGLYEATQKYFGSFILMLGPIPTPGGLTTIGVIFIALCVKFIFFSVWIRKKAGSHIVHFGILLLLLGGLITAVTQKEGVMVIAEGQSLAQYDDYYQRILMIKEGGEVAKTYPFSTLDSQATISFKDIEIRPLDKCDNCGVKAPTGIYENLMGLAQNMEIYSIASDKQKEANFSGVVLDIKNAKDDAQSGTYIVMQDVPKNPILNDDIEIILTKKKTQLPFGIKLLDFRKIDYPGTTKARAFESDLLIQDEAVQWPVTISMNKPLRYKGYTFFQSSFDERGDVDVTVLNVVQNKGRLFPYISTLIIFIGMVVHILVMLQSKPMRQEK